LGGVRIDGLDRMRVTMKVTVVNRKHVGYLKNAELAGLSVRHNLDLYNDTQVEKFVRRVAEKLETGSIALTKAIADITGQLEQYRLQQQDQQKTKKEMALRKEQRRIGHLSSPLITPHPSTVHPVHPKIIQHQKSM